MPSYRRRIAVLLASVCFLAWPAAAAAQTGSMRVSYTAPTAASLGKFGEVPVSLHTGTPDITIPLTVVRGRTLEVPVQLRYQPGGIRVEELGGWAGLGWALEAGGTITRTVRGLADEEPGGYWHTSNTFNNPSNWPTPSAGLIQNIRDGIVDGEPDQFYFNFAGRSGQIIMGYSTTGVQEVRSIPHQRIRIEPTISGDHIASWVITAEDGTKYTFGVFETSVDKSYDPSGPFLPNYNKAHRSSWHLTKIKSVGGDSITFHYSPYTATHRHNAYIEEFGQRVGTYCPPSHFEVIGEFEITSQRLDSIKGATHTVRFVPDAVLRQDARSPAPANAQQEPRLKHIEVRTPGNKIVRQFLFDHDYFSGGPNGRLRLKNVFEQDSTGAMLPPWSFTYDIQTLPAVTSFAQDHWGYHNGAFNSTLLPQITLPSGVVWTGANREVNSTAARAGSLKRITYPTGGYTEFTWESNDYGAINGDTTLQIGWGPQKSASISSSEFQGLKTTPLIIGGSQSVPVTITITVQPGCGPFEFCMTWAGLESEEQNQSTSYVVSLAPGNYSLSAYSNVSGGYAQINATWKEKVALGVNTAGGLRIAEIRTGDGSGAEQIRRYRYRLQSDTARSSGTTITVPTYFYSRSVTGCTYNSRSTSSRTPLGSGGQVTYREVTVLHGANGEYGRTREAFRSTLDASDDALPSNTWPGLRTTSRAWRRGQLTESVQANNAAQLQQRQKSLYTFPTDTTTRTYRGLATHVLSAAVYDGAWSSNDFVVESSWFYKSTDTVSTYNETGTSQFATVRSYVHGNPAHMQPTQITETNSDNKERITRLKYPADYASGASGAEAIAITTMKGSAHIHSPAVEKWVAEKVGSTETVLQAELSTFSTYGGRTLPYRRQVLDNATGITNFTPSTISSSFQQDSRYLTQETADIYDAFGRITQLTDARGRITNYLYGGANTAFLTKVTRVKDTAEPIDLVTDLTYDNLGNISSIKDEGGTFQYFTYDGWGRLRQIRNHANVVTRAYGYTYSRTAANSWTFQPSSPNVVLDTTYRQQTPSVLRIVSRQYLDGLGRPIQVSVQDGSSYHVTAMQYDAMGREWRAWRPYTRTSAAYDASFATNATSFYNTYLSVSNAKPYTETQYRPDALNRPMKITPEYTGTTATQFTQFAYGVDVGAKQSYVEVTDESGNKTRSFRDVFDNEVKTIRGFQMATPSTTVLVYNVLGQRTQVTDPRSLPTTYSPDTRGLVRSKSSPDGAVIQHKYDQNGNLRYTQDWMMKSSGYVLFNIYDFASRLTHTGAGWTTFSSLDPDVLAQFEQVHGTWREVRQYDVKPDVNYFPWNLFTGEINGTTLQHTGGRLAAVASRSNNAWQLMLYSYDADGRIAMTRTFTQANGGGMLTALNTTTTYERDLRGDITKRSVNVGSSAFHHWYDYDDRGLLWKVFASTSSTKPASADVTYTYRPEGAPATRQYLGDASIDFAYTIRGQLGRIGSLTSTTVPFAALYTYNPNGTMQHAEFRSNGTPAAHKRYRYSPVHDGKNQLTSAQYAYHNGTGYTSSNAYRLNGVAYDLSGNLTTLQRYRENATLIDNLAYTTGGTTNWLNSISDAIGATTEPWDVQTGSFTYDGNGNVTTAPAPYGITIATYDHINMPLSITSNGTTSTYRYNGESQRIAKQVGSGNTDVYILEGRTTLGVFSVNGSGTPVSWHFNILAGDRVVGRQPNGSVPKRYYHRDMLGSTRAVVQNGTIVESYDYDPWGVLMPGRTLAGPTREGFTGKERDETGLDYFGFRYYMSAVGRWTSVDPLSDQYSAWSPYNYVLNNAMALTDPDGREVRCRTRDDCERAAQELNAVHGDQTGISVEAAEWRQRPWWKIWSKGTVVQGYKLSTADSNYDWSSDKYASGLYDVINSNEITFDLQMVPGNTELSGHPLRLTAHYQSGRMDSRRGGGTVRVSRDGNRLNEPVGVVLMHELVGHGHPAGGSNAHSVNRFYQAKLGYTLAEPHGVRHRGYHERIGWKKLGLYRQ